MAQQYRNHVPQYTPYEHSAFSFIGTIIMVYSSFVDKSMSRQSDGLAVLAFNHERILALLARGHGQLGAISLDVLQWPLY